MADSFDDKAQRGPADPRFDRWLSWRLHDAYDSVLKEKLPADLERLVRLLGEREGAGTGEGDDDAGDGPPGPARGGGPFGSEFAGDGRGDPAPPMLMNPSVGRRG